MLALSFTEAVNETVPVVAGVPVMLNVAPVPKEALMVPLPRLTGLTVELFTVQV